MFSDFLDVIDSWCNLSEVSGGNNFLKQQSLSAFRAMCLFDNDCTSKEPEVYLILDNIVILIYFNIKLLSVLYVRKGLFGVLC